MFSDFVQKWSELPPALGRSGVFNLQSAETERAAPPPRPAIQGPLAHFAKHLAPFFLSDEYTLETAELLKSVLFVRFSENLPEMCFIHKYPMKESGNIWLLLR